MKNKLAGWKTEALSLSGQKVLTQFALATIPVYTMQAMSLPKGTCEEIDKTCCSFLWGLVGDQENYLVNWDEVLRPCGMGGLGLRKAKYFNDGLLAKVAWQVATNTNKLQTRVMHDKYVKMGDFLNASVPIASSWGWKSISRGISVIQKHACQSVGNGAQIDFWKNRQVGTEPLCLNHQVGELNDLVPMRVHDFVLNDHSWDVPKLQDVLSAEEVKSIYAIPIPLNHDKLESLYWPVDTSSKFLVRSAYNVLAGVEDENHEWDWL